MQNEMEVLYKIAQAVSASGGTAYFVGGCVRDSILGKENKDIDVEVHEIELDMLKSILSGFGKVDEVGKSFGILMIHGIPIDFALPRKEVLAKINDDAMEVLIPYKYKDEDLQLIKTAYPLYKITISKDKKYTHTDFIVVPDPYMSPENASRRRDFTINSLMKNVLTGEIIDCWGGLGDIERRVIRHIDAETFVEDALRVLRACQFASRFEFSIAPETVELCKKIDLSALPKERIYSEILKALMKGAKPSIAFEMMHEIGVVKKLFPELDALIGCPQNPKYHPEGDVWNHTMLVINGAAKLRERSKNPEVFMLAALLHDSGKPPCTVNLNGRITSYNHQNVGVTVAAEFLRRLTNDKKLIDGVCTIVKNHMRPLDLYPDATNKAIRRLAVEADINEVLLMAQADSMGKGSDNDYFGKIRDWFNERISEAGADKQIKPIVTGKDLINLGMSPDRKFKDILSKAFDMQLEGKSKEEIIEVIKNKNI
jgi:tRNA nucleotidyltransferase (CCA-adding enzyme)